MLGVLGSLSVAEDISLALTGVLVVLVTLIGIRAWKSSRITPAERERRRRAALAAMGKMGDAVLLEVRDSLLFYSYQVRGVEYTASQDLTALQDYLPADLGMDGPAAVKYHPRNPA